jgi:hypothetical protein
MKQYVVKLRIQREKRYRRGNQLSQLSTTSIIFKMHHSEQKQEHPQALFSDLHLFEAMELL